MLKSFHQFNRDDIALYVSVPEQEVCFFSDAVCQTVHIISDESYAGSYFADATSWGFSIGYFNQEICKLAFWETEIAENYLCIDSDIIFIRDFYVTDFMADDTAPYTVLVMDKDLSMEKHYRAHWQWRQATIQKIYDTVGLEDRRLRTCHGMQVLSAAVLRSLKNDFLASEKWAYKDLVETAPLEFTWYNAWFQKCGLVKEVAVEPFFKTFHARFDYTLSRIKQIRLGDLAGAYVGIILNSNWADKKVPLAYANPGVPDMVIYFFISLRAKAPSVLFNRIFRKIFK
jgi:hypothetical protein